jgi:hypothetical protein
MVDSNHSDPSGESASSYWQLREYTRKLVEDANAQDREQILKHIDAKFNELRATILSAFPDDDPIGHRAYHKQQMEYMEEKAKLYKDLRSKTLVGLVWLGLAFLGNAAWEHLRLLLTTGKPLP